MRPETTYTLEQLEELSTVRARTVRDYVARGLLTGAARPGPGAWHPESDLHRLLFIARLRRELGLSLGCIGELLGELGPEEIRRIGTGKERVSVLRLGGPDPVRPRLDATTPSFSRPWRPFLPGSSRMPSQQLSASS